MHVTNWFGVVFMITLILLPFVAMGVVGVLERRESLGHVSQKCIRRYKED